MFVSSTLPRSLSKASKQSTWSPKPKRSWDFTRKRSDYGHKISSCASTSSTCSSRRPTPSSRARVAAKSWKRFQSRPFSCAPLLAIWRGKKRFFSFWRNPPRAPSSTVSPVWPRGLGRFATMWIGNFSFDNCVFTLIKFILTTLLNINIFSSAQSKTPKRAPRHDQELYRGKKPAVSWRASIST